MVSLDSHFNLQGAELNSERPRCPFDSYRHWMENANPEELLEGGVKPGILIQLMYDREPRKHLADHEEIDRCLLDGGFRVDFKSDPTNIQRYVLEKNPVINLLVNYSPGRVSICINSDNPPPYDQALLPDLSQILTRIMDFIHDQGIRASLLPDDNLYEIFQTAKPIEGKPSKLYNENL